jgi:uncharacterized membrane protein
MIRTLLWLVGGVLLGIVIHIVVILILPMVAANGLYDRIAAFDAVDKTVALPAVGPQTPNPMRLDPDLVYAVCRLDLSNGPGEVSGALPSDFWSVAIFDRSGTVVYSTTNRTFGSVPFDLGIFNPAQTRLLAEQQLDVSEDLQIVESPSDQVFVVLRLAPPYPELRQRYTDELSALDCHNITN